MKSPFLLLSVLVPLGTAVLLAQNPPAAPAPEATANTANAPESAEHAPSNDTPAKSKRFKDDHVFQPPVTATVKDALNVRGQAALKSEAVAHLHKGDSVNVSELMTLRKPRKNEPANWARITLPSSASVWIFADYIDSKTMTVLAKKVNLRGGPGENYSVIGRLEKGTAIKEVGRRNGWIRIETPADAYGFVDADYLELQTNAAPVAVQAPAPAAPAAPPPEIAATAPAPASEPAKPAAIVAPEPSAAIATPPETPATAEAPPPKTIERIISREGVLRRTINVQAPADYELHDGVSGELIDYVQPQPKQDLKAYVGTRVMVSGPEVLDHRWPRTPILEVQTVDHAP